MRRRRVAALRKIETMFREEGWPPKESVHDEERDLRRFPNNAFVFRREHVNERRLREIGFIG
jgi:hypothetical protein